VSVRCAVAMQRVAAQSQLVAVREMHDVGGDGAYRSLGSRSPDVAGWFLFLLLCFLAAPETRALVRGCCWMEVLAWEEFGMAWLGHGCVGGDLVVMGLPMMRGFAGGEAGFGCLQLLFANRNHEGEGKR
jgi:hypothetical protein